MTRHARTSQLFSLALVITLLLHAILPAFAASAASTSGEQLRQAVRAAGTASYDRNSQAYLQRALDTLKPLATNQPGGGISTAAIAALQADMPGAFFDVSRVSSAASLDRTIGLIRDSSSAWTANKTSDPAVLFALTDLLLELRQSADVALTDARLIFGPQPTPPALPGLDANAWQRARNSYLQAEQAFALAFQQAAQGNDQATAQHFLLTWRKATGAMSEIGVRFTPGQTTDLDRDGVPDQLEVRLGARPTTADTDGDGLTDRFEVLLGGAALLPANPDTDRDRLGDADEDTDRDALNNRQEQTRGTDPLKADTDGDGLSDGQEVARGSDPLSADLDKDGLSDSAELRVSTDPRNPDTDGDGTLDGQDLLTGIVEQAGVRVAITGVGDVGRSLSIRPMSDEPAYQNMAGLVSTVTEITVDQPFSSARIELPIDLSKVPGGDIAGLRVMYFDEAVAEWLPVEGTQGFDRATGRFWTETTHFTAFAVFHIPSWDDFWTIEVCDGAGEAPAFINVALVLDSSGSMSWNDPYDLRKEGAKRLVRGLLEQDQAAVIDFDNWAYLLQPMTSNKAALEAAIDRIDSFGGTNIGAGVDVGLGQLEASASDRGRIMVLLTDGVGAYSSSLTDRAVASKVVIYTIGLGPDVDLGLLQTIAARTGGQFYHVLSAQDLPDVFERVGDEVGERDSDHDTLSNCEEIDGMPDVNGKLYYSDSKDIDSDGDGLLDNEEMGQPSASTASLTAASLTTADADEDVSNDGFDTDPEAFRRYLEDRPQAAQAAAAAEQPTRRFRVESDPLRFDTDGDGLDDGAEIANGTPRTLADWDGDGLNDYQELLHATEPDLADTDEDSFSDAYEVQHLSDGFDPLVVDERMTPEEWMRDFRDGLAAGDACDTWLSLWTPCKGTIPFFLGQLSGGATSFIPVVGWITGTIADLRDAIGSVVKGDWVGAGLSVVGLVPDLGDVGKIAGKIADFVAKFGKLEPLLRAVLRILPKAASAAVTFDGHTLQRQLIAGHTVANAGPPMEAASVGDLARDLVLEVMRKVNPAGFSDMARYGGDEFVLKLATMGAEWKKLADLFKSLETSGVFTQYPRLRGFVEEMIRTTPDDVLYGSGELLNLNSRVTLNVKKAAARMGTPRGDKLIETMRNQLKGALAENSTLAKLPGDADLIRVGHVTANGPDRVLRTGNIIDVLEVKAFPTVGLDNIKTWLLKSVDDEGKTIYEFNGPKLDEFLRRTGQPSLRDLLASNQLRYNLFVYDPNPRLTGELATLFGNGPIPIKDFDGKQILLTFTQHWEP